MWQKVSEKMPEMGVEVIGYNQDWVDEDFNPNGTRVCFYDDTGWYSAKWNNDQDSYSTVGCETERHVADACGIPVVGVVGEAHDLQIVNAI